MRSEDVHALLGRFAPRIATDDLPLAAQAVEAIASAHPDEPAEALAARVVARCGALLAPVPRRFEPDAPGPALARVERRLRAADELSGAVPPELFDGVPISWARSRVDRPTVVAWWQRWLAEHASSIPIFAYVHVPFCRTRCSFCQFASVVERGSHGSFLESVLEEAAALERALGPLRVDAATIGGGTPSSLTEDELRALLDGVFGGPIRVDPDAYFSAEMNPDSTTVGKVEALVERGVNRISLGVQSLHPATLAAVARGYQTTEMVRHAVACVRRFPDVQLSLDLLAPLPNETDETFRRGFAEVLDLAPDQLVLYPYQPVRRGRDRTVPPGDMDYERAAAALLDAALSRGMEAASHSGSSVVVQAPGTRQFPVRYVQHPREPTAVLGLGPFAESHVFGVGRYVASERPEDGYRGEEVSIRAEQLAYVGRHLGADLPLDDAAFEATFGQSMTEAFPDAIAYLEEATLLRRCGRRWDPAFPSRARALREAWVFLDPSALRRLRMGPAAERAEDAVGRVERALPDANGEALRARVEPLTRWLVHFEAAALVAAGRPPRAALLAELALDELGSHPDGIAALLRDHVGANDATARLVERLLCDGVLDRPRLRISEAGTELMARACARLPDAFRAIAATTSGSDVVPSDAALGRVERITVGPDDALALSFELNPETSRLWSRTATALPTALVELSSTADRLRYVRDGRGDAWLAFDGVPSDRLHPALAAACPAIHEAHRGLDARSIPRSLRVPLVGARPLLERAELLTVLVPPRSPRLPVAL